MINANNLYESARLVINIEIDAIKSLLASINDDFGKACRYFLDCEGRVIVLGMGKSGHIGNKIAATLASTGTPSFFIHPAEASHGDMGMVTRKDVILAISNSGETNEILNLLPFINHLAIPMITMTGNPLSTLARKATVNIDINVPKEACPLGLAPTSSTTATLVMGDAIAIALLEARGFTAENFALFHPGGSLGKRLLLKIQDLMRTGSQLPSVLETASIREALVEMTQKNLGMTSVVSEQNKLVGIYTDGDLRRTLHKNINLHETSINVVMTKSCKTIAPNLLAIEALQIMENHKITSLLVVDHHDNLVGVAHLHDLLNAGL
ncbi:MAG: KpsF/GutQ family sugar-phosphate isomerase [Gammaproteobacteria bacterium]|nr:KpsF/GutQ family sugar-phosphate isomerase [Gammaproteobacteria bacterium]